MAPLPPTISARSRIPAVASLAHKVLKRKGSLEQENRTSATASASLARANRKLATPVSARKRAGSKMPPMQDKKPVAVPRVIRDATKKMPVATANSSRDNGQPLKRRAMGDVAPRARPIPPQNGTVHKNTVESGVGSKAASEHATVSKTGLQKSTATSHLRTKAGAPATKPTNPIHAVSSSRTATVPPTRKIPTTASVAGNAERKRPSAAIQRSKNLAAKAATHVRAGNKIMSAIEIERARADAAEAALAVAEATRDHLNEMNRQKDELVQNLTQEGVSQNAAHEATSTGLYAEIEQLKNAYGETAAAARHLKVQLENMSASYAQSQQTGRDLKTALADVTQQFNDKCTAHSSLEETLDARDEEISQLKIGIMTLRQTVTDLNGKIYQGEDERRKLHNTIQELKGNIRVFCRVRPPLDQRDIEAAMSHIAFPDSKSLNLAQNARRYDGRMESKSASFTYDAVFGPTSTQEDVFAELLLLSQSALDGYQVCIFAYGPTGSGKTHTMEGPENAAAKDMGMIQRTAEYIFRQADEMRVLGWEFRFEGQFVEVYNERVFDLLCRSKSHKTEIDIKANAGYNKLPDALMENILSEADIMSMIRRAKNSRAVAKTECNDRSSRSHSIFVIHIHGYHEASASETYGALHLVDLAGSEKVSRSGVEGDRLTETKNINKSLSAMTDVFLALGGDKASHIPYRNSKLTFLLQNSLGGNSKTLMLVHVGPELEAIGETLNTLQFAARVNNVHIGTAKATRSDSNANTSVAASSGLSSRNPRS